METRTPEEIADSTEKLLEDLKSIVDEGEELLRSGAEELGAQGSAAREKLAAALEVARETSRKLQEKATAGAQAADEWVREYPYQSLAIAFGAGVILGVIFNRSR